MKSSGAWWIIGIFLVWFFLGALWGIPSTPNERTVRWETQNREELARARWERRWPSGLRLVEDTRRADFDAYWDCAQVSYIRQGDEWEAVFYECKPKGGLGGKDVTAMAGGDRT